MFYRFNSILTRCVLVVCCLPASVFAATPTAPDAGETTRELRPPTSMVAPRLPPVSRTQDGEGRSRDETRFRVNGIHIDGNSEFSARDLHALVTELEGGDHTLAELRKAAARITQYYRRHGYAVARAYLPEQEIKDGIVTIAVLEGRIDKQRIANHSRLSDARAKSYFKNIKEGNVIREAGLDRSLLLLSDTPGVGDSHATLQPGESVGTSDLLIGLSSGPLASGNVSVDNFGNRYTGEYRAGGTLDFNSPLHWGDQLRLTTLTSGNNLLYGRLAYQLPVGNDGLQMGVAYFGVRYRLGKEFSELDAHGSARGGSFFAAYPIIRSVNTNLMATIGLEQRDLTDAIDSSDTVTDKRVSVGSTGLSWSLNDALLGGGASYLDLAILRGRLDINSADAHAIDATTARSAGEYTRVSYSGRRLQRAGTDWLLALSFSGQQATKNLDSSEKFAVGGVSGVRAFPQGEGVGDEGYVWSVETRYQFSAQFQGIAFYDAGSSTLNHDRFGPPQRNERELSGAGIGASLNAFGMQWMGLVAWPITGGDPVSMPAHTSHTPLAWIQVAVLR